MSKRPRDEENSGEGKDEVHESLSVGDTNKLREKLGLKPLQEGAVDKQADADALLAAEREEAEKVKVAARIKKAKEKREYSKKSGRKGIAEEADEEDKDASMWVKKMRKKQGKAPTAAEKQAKMFDDADEAEQQAAYTSKDLKGLQMNATMDDFNEGREVIMTLKDESILDGDSVRDGGDALENAAFVERAAADKNKKLRGYKPGVSAYSGLDDHEWNEDGSINTEKKGVLDKYDSVIGLDDHTKNPVASMKIGVDDQKSALAREEAKKAAEIRGKIKENLNTLEFTKIKETYTQDEMASFQKPKKMRKKKGGRKKKESINWDAEEAKAIGEDHGSRSSRNLAKEKARDAKIGDAKSALAYQSALAKANSQTQQVIERDLGPQYDEEEEDDLGIALAKARQLKQKKLITHQSVEELATTVKGEVEEAKELEKKKAEEEEEEEEDEEKISLDPTTEFCKLVEVEEEKEDEEEEDHGAPMQEDEEEEEEPRRKMDMDDDDSDSDMEESGFTDENLVSTGMGAALDFIRGRGALNDTHEGVTGRFNDKTFTGEYVPNRDVDKDTGKKLNSFTLEYRDKFGRKMSQKEAFRQLSYGFHGKGPGKSKIEARQRKYSEEQRLRKQGQNGAIDQPITLQALKVQQKGTRQAHMVIGGGAGGMRHD